VVDTQDAKGSKSYDAGSVSEAMRIAKTNGRWDRPAVVWKRAGYTDYRPYRVVVAGKILK